MRRGEVLHGVRQRDGGCGCKLGWKHKGWLWVGSRELREE